MMYVNGQKINGDKFVWDRCYKIYIIDLEDIYNNSCPLRFISNWKLDKKYVKQFEENVRFEYE